MDKKKIKKRGVMILLGLFSGAQVLWADDPSAASAAQFESWLKNNGQSQLLSQNDKQSAPNNSSLQILPGSSPPDIPQVITRKKPRITPVKPMTYEESQKIILNSLPPSPPVSSESEEAFG